MSTNDEILAAMVGAYQGAAKPVDVIKLYSLTPSVVAPILVGLDRNSIEWKATTFFLGLTNTVGGRVYRRHDTGIIAPPPPPQPDVTSNLAAYYRCENRGNTSH